MGTGGDQFVLDTGDSVQIDELARQSFGLSGLAVRDANDPYGITEIEYSGLWPGEKIYK